MADMNAEPMEPMAFSYTGGTVAQYGVWHNYSADIQDQVRYYSRTKTSTKVLIAPIVDALYDVESLSAQFVAIGTYRDHPTMKVAVPCYVEATLRKERGIGYFALTAYAFENGVKGAVLFSLPEVKMGATTLIIP